MMGPGDRSTEHSLRCAKVRDLAHLDVTDHLVSRLSRHDRPKYFVFLILERNRHPTELDAELVSDFAYAARHQGRVTTQAFKDQLKIHEHEGSLNQAHPNGGV